MNFRIVLKTLGILACLMGLTMASCLFYAWIELVRNPAIENGESTLRAFGLSTAIAFGTGLLMMLASIGAKNEVLRREAIVIVGVSWIEVGLLGALPYYLGEPGLNAFSAFFESVSGFTTTGSTVMPDIEAYSAPFLLWRSLTQWLGGIGILVVFVAVLSFLGVGCRSIVQNESSINISDTGASRIRDLAFTLLKVYLTLSILCSLGLFALGMTFFDAVCHGMTTIATGGFSTKNASIGHYDNLLIEGWLAVFMFLSSISFMLYVFLVNKKWDRLKKEEEAKYYLLLTLVSLFAITLDLRLATEDHTFFEAFHEGFFNVVSISTTTGYGVSDYDQWPLFSRMMLIILMLIGGCAGSTAGGIKMNRIILFKKIAVRELVASFRPNQVFRIKLNGSAPEERVFITVSFFIALGFVVAGASTLLVALLEPNLDLLSSVGCVFGTLFNIGPGFEAVGPTDNFSILGSDTLVLLSFLMILGRLEFFALLVLFVPSLWRKY